MNGTPGRKKNLNSPDLELTTGRREGGRAAGDGRCSAGRPSSFPLLALFPTEAAKPISGTHRGGSAGEGRCSVLRRELGAAPRPHRPTHRRWTSSSSTVALNSTEAQLSPPSSGASVEKKANERERVGAARGCAAWRPNEGPESARRRR